MIPRVRIMDVGDGDSTYLEVNGHLLTSGVTNVRYEKEAGKPAVLEIRMEIDANSIEMGPEESFDNVYQKIADVEWKDCTAHPIITAQEVESGQVRVRGEIDGKKLFDEEQRAQREIGRSVFSL